MNSAAPVSLEEVFRVFKRWADHIYPENQGAALEIDLPDNRRTVLHVPRTLPAERPSQQ